VENGAAEQHPEDKSTAKGRMWLKKKVLLREKKTGRRAGKVGTQA